MTDCQYQRRLFSHLGIKTSRTQKWLFLPSKTATASLSPWLLKYNEIANETVLHFCTVWSFQCYRFRARPHSAVWQEKNWFSIAPIPLIHFWSKSSKSRVDRHQFPSTLFSHFLQNCCRYGADLRMPNASSISRTKSSRNKTQVSFWRISTAAKSCCAWRRSGTSSACQLHGRAH